jgi:cytochrome c
VLVLEDVNMNKLRSYPKRAKFESTMDKVKSFQPSIHLSMHASIRSENLPYMSAKFQAGMNVLKKLKTKNKICKLVTTIEDRKYSVLTKQYR